MDRIHPDAVAGRSERQIDTLELQGIYPEYEKIVPLLPVRCYVESRLADDIAVAEMAAVAGMDPTGFTRALRARTGLPPYAWLTERRMERACELLSASQKVTQVAHALGYANSGKFAAAFRRIIGANPTTWLGRQPE